MRSGNMMLLAVAVVAVGIFALPSTISLFAGQHTWYNLTENQSVPCEKCHADVANEMSALIGPHTGETGYQRMRCEYCHRYFPIWRRNSTYENYTYGDVGTSATDVTPGKESHAASTVPCMYCHSGNKSGEAHPTIFSNCWSCHQFPSQNPDKKRPVHEGRYTNDEDCKRCHANAHMGKVYCIPPAGGFNLTIDTTDTGELAAHKTFVMNAISDSDMEDANEACIACHTKIPVIINWTHRYSLEFNCTPEFEKLPPTHFNVTAWSINGTYNITVFGWRNGTGNTSKEGWPGSYP